MVLLWWLFFDDINRIKIPEFIPKLRAEGMKTNNTFRGSEWVVHASSLQLPLLTIYSENILDVLNC